MELLSDDEFEDTAITGDLLDRLKADQPSGCFLCKLDEWDEA